MRWLLLIAVFTHVHAADVPQSSRRDNRIQYVNYSADDVVVIHSTVGIASRIVFEKGESIVSIVSGFSDGWDITGTGRIMTIQPMSVQLGNDSTLRPDPKQWGTNIAVETTKRLYDFEVRLLSENYNKHDAQVFYRIQFNYPFEAEATARTLAAQQVGKAKQSEKVALPIPQNANYTMRLGKRSEGIAPTMAYDDGLFTYLRFPNNRDFPAVFIVSADGQEGRINTHVHDQRRDIMVIHRVARELILRLGNSVVAINNQSFDMDGLPPVNGSSTQSLKRIIRGVSQ